MLAVALFSFVGPSLQEAAAAFDHAPRHATRVDSPWSDAAATVEVAPDAEFAPVDSGDSGIGEVRHVSRPAVLTGSASIRAATEVRSGAVSFQHLYGIYRL
jgi:hypothetical protein